MDTELQKLLVAIYTENYLIDTQFSMNDSNYLVYSAKLSCSHGSTPTYLKLEETTDLYTNRKKIRHGITINGLPAANISDAKPDVNIGDFGICDLISNPTIQCTDLRNLAQSWNEEDRTMYVGSERGITKKAVLNCIPNMISKNGIVPGEIRAIDSGQMNLWQLIEKFRSDYLNCLTKSIKNQNTTSYKTVLQEFAAIVPRDEFIYLYELYYPDRGRAFDEFSKQTKRIYSEHVKNIKLMIYLLVKDEYTKSIIQTMANSDKYHMEIYDVTDAPLPASKENPYVAYFSSFGKKSGSMIMHDISGNAATVPSYKVFFHESGHAIDYFNSPTETSYSYIFKYECPEAGWLSLNLSNNLIEYKPSLKPGLKSIHEFL